MNDLSGTILVTGGMGFIGSNFVRYLLREHPAARVVNLDKVTYAGNPRNLADVAEDSRYTFVRADVCDANAVAEALTAHGADQIVHFAAETHVDRSILEAGDFIRTNIEGTRVLLDAARKAGVRRFLHVSTDEVYGSLGPEGLFTEKTPYDPSSPYSASKASADHLARAYQHTYGLPVMVTNCSNNYGPYQFPEKLIPLMILNAAEGKKLPIYGDGMNVRDWLFVEDHCRALWCVLTRGIPGETYNIGGSCEQPNIEIVRRVCALVDDLRPGLPHAPCTSLITYVKDRPGHDRRYAIDAGKILRELGWQPEHNFESGLRQTVQWYLENPQWVQRVQSGKYRRERLGLGEG